MTLDDRPRPFEFDLEPFIAAVASVPDDPVEEDPVEDETEQHLAPVRAAADGADSSARADPPASESASEDAFGAGIAGTTSDSSADESGVADQLLTAESTRPETQEQADDTGSGTDEREPRKRSPRRRSRRRRERRPRESEENASVTRENAASDSPPGATSQSSQANDATSAGDGESSGKPKSRNRRRGRRRRGRGNSGGGGTGAGKPASDAP